MVDHSKDADDDDECSTGTTAAPPQGEAVSGSDDDEDEDNVDVSRVAQSMRRSGKNNRGSKDYKKIRPIDVAEILVAPVSVTYTVPCSVVVPSPDDPLSLSTSASGEGGGATLIQQKEKMAVFWVVILKTRKCYNFNKHLEIMVNDLDKEEKSRVQKLAAKEFVDVMNMMREVFLFQYKNSPNVITHLKKEGVGSRVDPFQRLSGVCTPDSLDSICSVYEAYRSIIQQVEDLGNLSDFIHSRKSCSTPSAMHMLSCFSKNGCTLVSGSAWKTPNTGCLLTKLHVCMPSLCTLLVADSFPVIPCM